MAFKITARTLLELGAELISSDSIAFYELIKNPFDADSPRVEINVIVRIPYREYEVHHELLTAELKKESFAAGSKILYVEKLSREHIEGFRCNGSITTKTSKPRLILLRNLNGLCTILEKANFIQINDTGHGMTLIDLQEKYLTIGTRSRYQEKRKPSAKSGDRLSSEKKGIGRLSVMRLRMDSASRKYNCRRK